MAKKNNNTQPTLFINPFTRIYGSGDPLIILVGTMGGKDAGKLFYTFPYSGKLNRMWCLLPVLFCEPSLIGKSDVEKEIFLIRHKIAMYDICESGLRKMSADDSIKKPVVNNFDKIVSDYPNAKIACVGNIAHKIFTRYFPHISCIRVPSTSGNVAGISCEDLLDLYRNAFLEKFPTLYDAQTILSVICSFCKRKNKFNKHVHQTI